MLSPFVPPATVALLWFYEGLWCKVLGRRDDQRAIVDSVPFLPGGWTAAEQIDEPGRLVAQDAIFLVLVWLVAARHEAANR